jgi:hypothetical protein
LEEEGKNHNFENYNLVVAHIVQAGLEEVAESHILALLLSLVG